MGPQEKSFEQVRSILSKLGRDIDQIRTQRTTPPVPHAPARQEPRGEGLDTRVGGNKTPDRPGERAAPARPAQPQQQRPGSNFGRATPLPPRNP